MTPTELTQIMDDLSRHYRERVCDVTEDALDTMEIAKIPKKERVVVVVRNLLMHAACLCMIYKMTKPDFLQVCEYTYNEMEKAASEHP